MITKHRTAQKITVYGSTTLALAMIFMVSKGEAKSFWLQKDSVLPTSLSYSDLADLYGAAPIVAEVRIRKSKRISVTEAGGSARSETGATTQRYLVEADLVTLIRAPGPLGPRIRYLIDSPQSPKAGKTKTIMIAAQSVPGDATQVQILSGDSAQPTNPELTQRVRSVVEAFSTPGTPPAITGISGAFFTPGNLPEEGETQIFLQTMAGTPLSLIILRRPGAAPRWAPAFGDTVDADASPPARNTVGWYRLACGLPTALPEDTIATLTPQDRAAVRRDYQFVRDSLGSCGRTLNRR